MAVNFREELIELFVNTELDRLKTLSREDCVEEYGILARVYAYSLSNMELDLAITEARK